MGQSERDRWKAMLFQRRKTYTREQIHAALGGELWSYLPVKDGRVVAGCFRPDLNPGAPEVILPGTGDRIEDRADLLATQADPIPVFLKDSPSKWRYVGDYRCVGLSRDKAEIASLAKKAGRDDVTCVLRLESASAKVVIRHPTPGDAVAWEALRTTADPGEIGLDGIAGALQKWQGQGYGLFLVEELGTRAAVGIAGLDLPHRNDGPQLLCAIAPTRRQRSYALDACRQVLAWASGQRLRVFAHVEPENEAGLRLAMRLGGQRTEPTVEGFLPEMRIDFVFP